MQGVFPIALYLFFIIIPAELYFEFGSLRLEPYRFFLIIITLLFTPKLLAFYKRGLVVKALFAYIIFCCFSFIVNHGVAGIESSLILFLEIFIGYYIGLQVKGSLKTLSILILTFAVVLILLAPFGMVETTNGYRVLHVWAANLAGTEVIDNLGESYFRHGLHRAGTVFSHPILYSICAVMILPIVYRLYKGFIGTLLSLGIFTALITSVTSAGIIMVLIQFGLYMCRIISSFYYRNIFKVIVWTIASLYIFLSFASNRGPILLAIQFMSLNPATAYSRYQQWLFSSDDIMSNPLWGIGFNEWSRPHWMQLSIDSFWLMTALQNGFPALIALAVVFIISMKAYWKSWRETGSSIYFAFFCSVFSLVFAGFTVDFFDRAQLLCFLFLGIFNSFVYSGFKGARKKLI